MIPVLKSEGEILKHLRKNIPPCSKEYICFFSSHLKAFVTDPLFMNIPLEDKMVHRGYSIFETTKIFGNKVYQLDKHLDRFTSGIKKIDLTPMYSRQEMRDILVRLASIARKIEPTQDIELRYFFSAGLGNLSIVVNDNYYSFYAIAYRTNFSVRPVDGVQERVIPMEQIKKNVSSSKTTNYLINALVTKKAKELGGYLGIMTDENGYLLESPMSNIAFVLKDGSFNVPPFDKTLVGTTVLRILEYVQSDLIPNGLIKRVSRDYISVDEFPDLVEEAMLCGGDFAIPILKLDEVTFSKEPGPITTMIKNFLINDKKTDDVAEEIPELEENYL
jgi:branched-subunit amino acid aminotransferase/4-amino-4-deoxychorismate lyase